MSRPAVLCVDDEPNLLRGLQLHLRRHFEVTTTTDPEEALRWLTERRIPLEGLLALHDPIDAQEVYQRLLHDKAEGLFQVFNWAKRPDEPKDDG